MDSFEKELKGLDAFEAELNGLDGFGKDSVGPFGEFDLKDPGELREITPAGKPQSVIQEALGSIATYVDIVFAIDLTGSMTPIIDTVKKLALDFYDELIETMREKENRQVEKLRVKVIGFRDFYCDGSDALEESYFFTLPDQKEEFHNYVNSLIADGGGDEPENSLEALALAMKTDWVKVSNPNTERARNVIVLFTDATAHTLEKAKHVSNPLYPSDMVKSYKDIYEAWNGQGSHSTGADKYNMDQRAKRLIVFAPDDAYPWNDIAEDFDNTAIIPISMASGGEEIGRSTIVTTISGSIK